MREQVGQPSLCSTVTTGAREAASRAGSTTNVVAASRHPFPPPPFPSPSPLPSSPQLTLVVLYRRLLLAPICACLPYDGWVAGCPAAETRAVCHKRVRTSRWMDPESMQVAVTRGAHGVSPSARLNKSALRIITIHDTGFSAGFCLASVLAGLTSHRW